MTDDQKITYRAVGSVRGWCGHNHHTWQAAEDCALRDNRRCKQVGGYSDRLALAYVDGRRTPPTIYAPSDLYPPEVVG